MCRSSLVSRITFALLLGGALSGGLTGCQSGEGERCQITEDCASGLVCSSGTDTCVEPASEDDDGGIDAPIDASDPDATPVVDAPPAVDAAVDAAIDAAL